MEELYYVEDICKYLNDLFKKNDLNIIKDKIENTKISLCYFTTQDENMHLFKCIQDSFNKYKCDSNKIELLKKVLLKDSDQYPYNNVITRATKVLDFRYTTRDMAFEAYKSLEVDKDFTNFLLENNFIKKSTLKKFKNVSNNKIQELKNILVNFTKYDKIKDLEPFKTLMYVKKIETEILDKMKKIPVSKLTQDESMVLSILSVFMKTDNKIKIFDTNYQRCYVKTTREPLTQLKSLITYPAITNTLKNAALAINAKNIKPDIEFYNQIENKIIENPNMIVSLVPYLMVLAGGNINTQLPETLLKYKNIVNLVISNIYSDYYKYYLSTIVPKSVDMLIEKTENQTMNIINNIVKNF